MPRPDARAATHVRSVSLERGAVPNAEGSCLVRFGTTEVLCAASVQEGIPPWRRESGLGWVTAEYAMLPRATTERTHRERRGAGGRTSEIQRLIGRSLRAALSTFDFGEYTIYVDCDVIRADGGTRTAAITGGAVALADACGWLSRTTGGPNPFGRLVAAVSVGIVAGDLLVDLCYEEDRAADVDANLVMAEPDGFVELQATAERNVFRRPQLDALIDMGQEAIGQLFALQHAALDE